MIIILKIIKIVLLLGNFDSSFLVITLSFLNLCVLPQGVHFISILITPYIFMTYLAMKLAQISPVGFNLHNLPVLFNMISTVGSK